MKHVERTVLGAASLVLALALAPTSTAQQSFTVEVEGTLASGKNAAAADSKIILDLVSPCCPRPIILPLAVGEPIANISSRVEAAVRTLGFGTTRLSRTAFGIVLLPDGPTLQDGAVFASDDTAVGLGLLLAPASVKINEATKTNGIAVPCARADFTPRSAGFSFCIIIIERSTGNQTKYRITITPRSFSSKDAVDAALLGELTRAGLVVNRISVRSRLQPQKNLDCFGIDKTTAGDDVIGIELPPEFVASGIFDIETATGWLPTAGFAEFGVASPGGLSRPPSIAGSGSPQVGSTYFANADFEERRRPAALVLAGGRAATPVLGAWLLVDLATLVLIPAKTDARGRLRVAIPVPNDPGLAGARLFHQAFAITTTLAPATTPGLFAAIGR